MTDAEFLRALESGELPESDFGHAAHVRAAYLYLRPGDFAAALGSIRAAIGGYARRLGKPGRYHETITVAYLALIQEHICQRGDGGGWPGFARDNPELLQPDLLLHFYRRSQLQSELARKVFLLPRPAALAADACA
ncbi:MAG TPA: hypothetical protein VK130_13325 [Steroidobacteraceae bacterium]|nr:hypothetical protein [Steroidobacteraceae bacterium]